MEFALVPKGKSWLGGGGGKPGEQEVEIKQDFYLGVYEVTQEEWEKVTGKNPSEFSRNGIKKIVVIEIADADLKRFPGRTSDVGRLSGIHQNINEQGQGNRLGVSLATRRNGNTLPGRGR